QLQIDEADQRRTANEIRLGNPASRLRRKALRQASRAKASRPHRAHALRVLRRVTGCEMELQSLSLSLRRICSELVQVDLSVSCLQFSLDLFPDPMDRSNNTNMSGPINAKLVRRERNYYFVGSSRRE